MYYYQSLLVEDIEHMAEKALSMQTTARANVAAEVKTQAQAAANVKPCCVCKDEKATRDECMLFSNAKDPQKDCAPIIDKYKSCMAGFGFQMP